FFLFAPPPPPITPLFPYTTLFRSVHVAGRQAAISGFTQAVSANGAVVILPEGLAAGSKMILENPSTKHRVEAHVVRPPQFSPEGSLVPIEFLSPASQFWNEIGRASCR